jgi:hypothetical protein
MYRVFLFVIVFFLAATSNFWAGLKYPDVEPSIWGFIASIIYLIFLYSLKNKQFLLISAIGSLITGLLLNIELYLVEFALLDFLSAFQYPLYGFLIMPLFGLNMLFLMPIDLFALFCAGIYLSFFLFCLIPIKRSQKA